MDVSIDLLAQGYRVRFRAAGGSMRPSIGDGDVLTVAPLPPAGLRPGAIAVYRAGRRLFAHRLVATGSDASGLPILTFCGDATLACDAPVRPDQLVGEVVAVERGPRLASLASRLRALAGRLKKSLCGTTLVVTGVTRFEPGNSCCLAVSTPCRHACLRRPADLARRTLPRVSFS